MAVVRPFLLTVKAVVFDPAGRCLLVRRSAANRNFVGFWEWPGGKVDPGEDFAAATIRETAEETGLAIGLTALAGATSFEMPAATIVLLCMEAQVTGGELRLSHEHDAFEWVPPGELGRLQLIPGVDAFMLEYAQRCRPPSSPPGGAGAPHHGSQAYPGTSPRADQGVRD